MSRERDDFRASKCEDSRVDLEKKIIILEAEKDKINALFAQQVKILQERVEEAEKKEKEAVSSKNKMLKVLENWKGDEKTVNDKISSLQTQYEATLNEMKAQHEEELTALKQQIEDMKQDAECKSDQKHAARSEATAESISQGQRVKELETKLISLEKENMRLASENMILTTRSSQLDRDSSRQAYFEELSKVKEDNRELTRIIQKEYGMNITSIVSEYERKLTDIQTKLLIVVQGCSPCTSKLVECLGTSDFRNLKDLVSKSFEFRGKMGQSIAQEPNHNQLQTLRSEVNQLRNSLMQCEKKMAFSSQNTGRYTTSDEAFQRSYTKNYEDQYAGDTDHLETQGGSKSSHLNHSHQRDLETLADSVDYSYPSQPRDHMLIRNDQDEHREDASIAREYYAPKQHTSQKPLSRTAQRGAGIETPMRTRPPLHSRQELMNRSGVRIVDSGCKEDQEVAMSHSQYPGHNRNRSSLRRQSHNQQGYDENDPADFSPYGFGTSKHPGRASNPYGAPSGLRYPPEHYDLEDSQQAIASEPRRGLARYHDSHEEHESQGDLHQHVSMLIDRVSKNEQSHYREDSVLTSTPTRSYQASGTKRPGFTDKGFLNFYRENWHSSTFTLEQD